MNRDAAQPKLPLSSNPRSRLRWLGSSLVTAFVLILLAAATLFFARYWLRHAAEQALPQTDGTLHAAGLAAPVTVIRDANGVPHLRAASFDDLVFAQGYVTAQDRLFQMDLLRRHAAGKLAETLGSALVEHDRIQRTLQLDTSAQRAFDNLAPGDRHMLERYTLGVNAAMAAQMDHLPLDFRVLRYQPAAWKATDCMLVAMVLFEDMTSTYQVKLARESLTARLSASLPAPQAQALLDDLYPVGSWRDHPPSDPVPDLTIDGPPIEQVPLDETQSRMSGPEPLPPAALSGQLAAYFGSACLGCVPGSNNWVVSGVHTASGKPMLSNDMHLGMTVPGLWYENDLEAPNPQGGEPFHVAGVSIPGLPLVVVGHNQHVAWGFTNSGADVQDIFIETITGTGDQMRFRAADGSLKPVRRVPQVIHVKGESDKSFDLLFTEHSGNPTPIITALVPGEKRSLALDWTLYDANITRIPFFAIDSAVDGKSLAAAFSSFGGPSQNVVYADDQGHIGYHLVGAIPLRGAPIAAAVAAIAQAAPSPRDPGDIQSPPASTATMLSGPLNGVPVVATAANEWSGYIPYDRLPQVVDPPGGVIATANSRITPGDYPYPITLNWSTPYRNERIWRLLAHRKGLVPADMLALQTDVDSDFDRVLAERIAYALDHSDALAHNRFSAAETRRLHQAADLLRSFKGRMTIDSAAAAVTSSVHRALLPALLWPKLVPAGPADKKAAAAQSRDPQRERLLVAEIYRWSEDDYALEQILTHTPPRWLPAGFASWNDFLAETTARALVDARAPQDLAKWRYGSIHTVGVYDLILGQSRPLELLYGRPIGTGERPLSGDRETIKQVDHAFGPSERLTVDLADPDRTTLNTTMGQSGNPGSPWFLDQFPAWLKGTTLPFAFSDAAIQAAPKHRLTLAP